MGTGRPWARYEKEKAMPEVDVSLVFDLEGGV
jgi:hypothetical protein